MSYYMGDFYGSPSMYRGPGRGDPGFFSALGGLFKRAVGAIPGVGPIAQGAMDIFKGGAVKAGKQVMEKAGTAIIKHPTLSAAATAGAAAAVMGAGAGVERMVMGRHMGHVLPKCGKVLKSGHLGKCHRRMNVCNPRALRRSIRRCHGFAKLAMKTIHIVHPKKKGRFGGFKRRRRK